VAWISTGKDELLETAIALHEAAMKDDYFIKRKLAPNVDFWYVHLLDLGSRSLILDTGGDNLVLDDRGCSPKFYFQWLDLSCYGFVLRFDAVYGNQPDIMAYHRFPA